MGALALVAPIVAVAALVVVLAVAALVVVLAVVVVCTAAQEAEDRRGARRHRWLVGTLDLVD